VYTQFVETLNIIKQFTDLWIRCRAIWNTQVCHRST